MEIFENPLFGSLYNFYTEISWTCSIDKCDFRFSRQMLKSSLGVPRRIAFYLIEPLHAGHFEDPFTHCWTRQHNNERLRCCNDVRERGRILEVQFQTWYVIAILARFMVGNTYKRWFNNMHILLPHSLKYLGFVNDWSKLHTKVQFYHRVWCC